jgi:hypothetical protein
MKTLEEKMLAEHIEVDLMNAVHLAASGWYGQAAE